MIVSAFGHMLNPGILVLMIAGAGAGVFVGAMPGLTATMALALLLPFTFNLPALSGLAMLGAVYTGAIYGGMFSAILINTPGTPSSIATTFDGYPMARKGQADQAIAAGTVASVLGGLIGVVGLLFLAPPLASLALKFSPADFFWVAVLGLTLISSLASGSLLKGYIGGLIGILISTIGIAPIGGDTRFTFGVPVLQGGVALLVALIGLFAIPEVLTMASSGRSALPKIPAGQRQRGVFLATTLKVLAMPGNLLRSSILGLIVGIIPGAGGNVASLLTYNEAKRASKTPERFGTGVVEGVVASESANNAVVPGGLIPLLTLGVPGAPPDAIILGVLLLHGLRPGSQLFTASGTLTYTFILSLGLSALMMLPIGIFAGRAIYRVVAHLPHYFLVPAIVFMTFLGAYALRNSVTDVLIMAVLGILGFALRELGFHPGPIVLGLILGPIAEEGLIQALLTGGQYPSRYINLIADPISWVLAFVSILTASWPLIAARLRRRRERLERKDSNA